MRTPLLLLLAIALIALAACGGTTAPRSNLGARCDLRPPRPSAATAGTSGDPVLIGIAVAQTSNVALLGQEQVIGAKLAEKFFNDRGGINGRPIKLIYQDTAGDEQGAINAFPDR